MGENRHVFVPNPAATSHLQLAQFEFMGKMIGLALRTRNLFSVALPSIIWKPLVGAPVTLDDLEAIDVLSTNALKSLLDDEKVAPDHYNSEMADIKFTVTGPDRVVHELCPGGAQISLTYANRQEYAALLRNYRLNEFQRQTTAIRTGLGQVVPLSVFGLFTWQEAERMVCGNGFSATAVDLLKRTTEYKAYSANHQHVKWLWEILAEDFNDEQRAQYLVFVWGRSRMPATAQEFDTMHKISSRSGGDAAFPMAHTCFFTIDLPEYSRKDIMRQRLSLAISMCGGIDGD
jgi:hypothetical protein